MDKQMLFKELNSVWMDKKDRHPSLVLMVKILKLRFLKLFDYRMVSLFKHNLSMEPRVLTTVNSLQALVKELLLQVNLMDKGKWVAILHHRAAECNPVQCLQSVTRFQERRSLWRSTPKSSLSSVPSVFMQVNKVKIDISLFRIPSKSFLHHLSSSWERMLMEKIWGQWHRKVELKTSV